MSIKSKIVGTWRNFVQGYVKLAGTWRTVDVVYIKENGTWRISAQRISSYVGQAYDTASTSLVSLGYTVSKANTNSTDTTYAGFSGGYVQSHSPGIDELAEPGQTIILNTITYVTSQPSFNPGFNPGFGGGFTPPPVEPPPLTDPFWGLPIWWNPYYEPPGWEGWWGGGFTAGGNDYFPPPDPPPPAYDPYQGGTIGSGCLLGTTKVWTPNLGLIEVRDLVIGDKLVSVDVEEIDLDEVKSNYRYWLSESFTIKSINETSVTKLDIIKVQDLIEINEEMYSVEHPILVERNNEYEFVQAQFVKETDKVLALNVSPRVLPVLASSSEEPLTKFVPIEHLTRHHYKAGVVVYNIGVEPYDVYFTERMLSHNK